MTRTRLVEVGLVMAGALAVSAGCSTTNPFGRERLSVASTTQYVGGRGFAMFTTTPDLSEHVKQAMTEVGFTAIHPIPEANGGTGLEGSTADKRSARVSIHSTGVRSTVALKVGWLGDEPLTRAFLQRLEERHGALPASAVPVEPDADAEANPSRFSRGAVPDSVMIRNQLDPSFNPSISP